MDVGTSLWTGVESAPRRPAPEPERNAVPAHRREGIKEGGIRGNGDYGARTGAVEAYQSIVAGRGIAPFPVAPDQLTIRESNGLEIDIYPCDGDNQEKGKNEASGNQQVSCAIAVRSQCIPSRERLSEWFQVNG